MTSSENPASHSTNPGATDNDTDVDQIGNRSHALLRTRLLVLDGAMGTMIQRYKLTEADFRGEQFKDFPRDLKGNSDLLVMTRPDVIGAIHREYLAAGADIIETNTFTATVHRAGGLRARVDGARDQPRRRAGRAAKRRTSGRRRRPIGRASSPAPSVRSTARCRSRPKSTIPSFRAVTFDQVREAYEEQVRALIDGGVDILLLETIFDTLNAKAGIVAIENVFEEKGVRLPLMISVTITDRSGRTLSGQTLEAFYISIRHARPFSVGINCALGARDMRPYMEELSRLAECYVSSLSERRPARTPSASTTSCRTRPASCSKDFAASGFANIVGGCCGTTPPHIAAIAAAVEGVTPRPLPPDSWLANSATPNSRTPKSTHYTRFSGLEPLVIRPDANFQMIGERTNVTGSREVRAPDQVRELHRGRERRRRSGAKRRQHHRRQHGRGHARLRAGDDHVPQLHRHRARDRARAGDDRQLEVDRARGRPQVRPGQERRQLHQPQGRGRGLPQEGEDRPALRRRRRRHGVRRGGAGRHHPAQGGDLPARLQAADRAGWASIRPTSSSIRTSSRSRPGSRSTTTTRSTSSRRRGSSRRRVPA